MSRVALKSKTLSRNLSAGLAGALAGVFVAAFSLMVSAGVYDDAIFWFRGGKTVGPAVTGSLFDEVHADNTDHANHKGAFIGYEDCRSIVREKVQFPSWRDDPEEVNVLRLKTKRVVNGTTTNLWQCSASAKFLYGQISNEYTMVARIRRDYGNLTNSTAWLSRLGYNGAQGGVLYGFTGNDAITNKVPIIYYGGTNSSGAAELKSMTFSNLRLPHTNEWVDICLIVSNHLITAGVARRTSFFSRDVIEFQNASVRAYLGKSLPSTDGTWRFFCENYDSSATAYANAKKTAFCGSVQQIAIWPRALTREEVREAWGYPNAHLLKVGLENGASNEFSSDSAPVAQTIDPYMGWHSVSPRFKAGATWTIPFYGNTFEAGYNQLFTLLSVPGSASGTFRVAVNGTSAVDGAKTVQPGRRAVWFIPGAAFTMGTNTLTITRTDAGAEDVVVDSLDLGGSLQIGANTEDWNNLSSEGRISAATSVSTRDIARKHWPQAANVNSWSKNRDVSFYVPDYVANFYPMTFTLRARMCELDAKNDAHLDILVNGVPHDVYYTSGGKTIVTNCIGKSTTRTDYSIDFAPGDLQPGWNSISLRGYKVNNLAADDLKGYYLFNHYKFTISGNRANGTILIVR